MRISVDAVVSHGKTKNPPEAMLLTHRGLSGPSILQISSYWREGDTISVAMLPGTRVFDALRAARTRNGRQALQTALGELLPKRLAQLIAESSKIEGHVADLSDKQLLAVENAVNEWQVKPCRVRRLPDGRSYARWR